MKPYDLDKIKPHIHSVITKLETGEYPTEPTVCPCGGGQDSKLVTRDRYMIPHTMVMCQECGLIRANPRMTPAAYHTFYNTEYRPLYDGHEWGETGLENNDGFRFLKQGEQGSTFKEFLEYFGVKPKSVVEVGSSFGGYLQAFKETGAKVYGVEIDQGPRVFANSQNIPTTTSLDALIDMGVKADLVILQDIIEHLMDFSILDKLPKLLDKHGHVYVCTPGLFKTSSFQVWQNAHVWQFVAGTLEFVMAQHGFEAEFLDESIHSIWAYNEHLVKPPRNNQWCGFIAEHVRGDEKRTMPPVRGVCKFSQDERMAAVRANLVHKHPDLGVLIDAREKATPGTALVISGGPSVDGFVEDIKAKQAAGAHVFCIERMYPWCYAHGITPEYVVALDGCDDVVEGFTHIMPGVKYLMGTAVQPKAVDLLAGQEVYFYNAPLPPNAKPQDAWYEAGYKSITIVSVGGSVALAAYSLAQILNYPDVHFYGFDLKIPNPDTVYARDIGGRGVPREYFYIEVLDKKILTCLSFIGFAQQFFSMTEEARKRRTITAITIHGDSLINDMWDGKFIEVNDGKCSDRQPVCD